MKGIIIVKNFPENCRECDYYGVLCKITNKKCKYYNEDGKPDWCPIKELPDKFNVKSIDEIKLLNNKQKINESLMRMAYIGWNSCLNQILKDK